MSKQLCRVLKKVIFRVGVDQHSRGIHFGSIGYLCGDEGEQWTHKEKPLATISHSLMSHKKSTYLLSKADPTSSDQHDPAIHVNGLVLQQIKVFFLPVMCIQDSALGQKKDLLMHFSLIYFSKHSLN